MPNLNTAIRYRPKAERNPHLHDLTDAFKGHDNAEFFAEVAKQLRKSSRSRDAGGRGFDPGGVACIGLLGEYGLLGYGLRRAQEVVRVDGTSSYWSHAFLVAEALSTDPKANRDAKRSAWIWESSLEPGDAFTRFIDRSGVGARRISDYAQAKYDPREAHCVPNVGVIAIALTATERKAILDRADDPMVDQIRFDVLGLLGTWFAYLTQRATRPNPLVEGHAMFNAAYVQLAYDAAGIDLAAGSLQRNIAPEHVWQSARYLSDTFRAADPKNQELVARKVMGWYCARDRACIAVPDDPKAPQPPRTIREAQKRAEA